MEPSQLFDPALVEVKKKFESEGWCCSSPSETGLACRGKMPQGGFPNDIVLMVPPYYRPQKKATFSVFLHGHLMRKDPLTQKVETIDTVLRDFGFDQKWARSGRNSILVIPASVGRDTTFKEWFNVGRVAVRDGEAPIQGKGKFPEFLQFLAQQAQGAGLAKEPQVGSLSFTAHSGGSYPLAGILEQDCVASLPCAKNLTEELILLDSVYEVSLPGQNSTVITSLTQFRTQHPTVPVMSVGYASIENSEYLAGKVAGKDWKKSNYLNATRLRTDLKRKKGESDADYQKRIEVAEKAFTEQVSTALTRGLSNSHYFLARWGVERPDHWEAVNQFLPIFWGKNP